MYQSPRAALGSNVRTLNSGEDTRMELRTALWRHLPEELVEKVIAMLPFPSIFKARALSKSWLARLSSVSSLDDEGKKRFAISFQKQVAEWSANWETFCPVCFGNNNFLAYRGASGSCQKLPSLSILLENQGTGDFSSQRKFFLKNLQIEGALLYGFTGSDIDGLVEYKNLHVINILTQSWKQLPSFPCTVRKTDVVCTKLVCDESSQTYKVIVFYWDSDVHLPTIDRCYAQVYDSKSDAWNTKDFTTTMDCRTSAYRKGILYLIKTKKPQTLLAYNVEKETLKELRLTGDVITEIDSHRVIFVHLLVCNAHLLVIVCRPPVCDQPVQVLKVDLRSRKLLRLADGPPDSRRFGEMFARPVTDGRNIFFGRELNFPNRVVAYNAKTDTWSCLLVPDDAVSRNQADFIWTPSSFQPGLNAFMDI